VSVAYLDALRDELAGVGIRGRRRERIVTEIADHLACDPAAKLGAPREIARQFADELGTVNARRAAARSFAALAIAGLLFGAAFAGSPAAAFGAAPAGASVVGRLARIVAVLAPQIALVAGLLASLRAVRRRGRGVIAAAEARIILRRAVVATVAGLATSVSLGVIALVFGRDVSSGWQALALVASGTGTVALLAALPSLWAAARLRPVAPGTAGDLFDDLGPIVPAQLRGRPWRLAIVVAAGVAVAIALAGAAGDDLYDGIARGVADGLVCLAGFGTLGRYLGLWSPGGAVADS
jgi:hypothetical protein